MITVRTQVKEVLKANKNGPNNISDDFINKLDEKVKELVLEAAQRAKDNGRRTVMGKDL